MTDGVCYTRYRLAVHWSSKLTLFMLAAFSAGMFIFGIFGFISWAFIRGNLGNALLVLVVIWAVAALPGAIAIFLARGLDNPDANRVELRDTGLVVVSPFASQNPRNNWSTEMHFDYANVGRVSEQTKESHVWGRVYPMPAKAGHIDVDLIEPLQTRGWNARTLTPVLIRTLHLTVDDPYGFRSELLERLPEGASADRPRDDGSSATVHADGAQWAHLERESSDRLTCASCGAGSPQSVFCGQCGNLVTDPSGTVKKPSLNHRFFRDGLADGAFWLLPLIGLVFWCPWLAVTARRSQSPAKRLGSVYILDARTLRAVDPGTVWSRELLIKVLLFMIAASLLLYIPTMVDAIWMVRDPDRRALHDRMAGTIVVHAPGGLPREMRYGYEDARSHAPDAETAS